MFKKYLRKFQFGALLGGLCGMLLGCHSLPPFPAANLKDPGWQVRQGQAVWKAKASMPEIAGDLIVATRPGEAFAQFSKPPFPLMTAQLRTNGWEILIPTQNKRFSAPGRPPARILLLQLAAFLEHQPAAKNWFYTNSTDGSWTIWNGKSGERMQGFFE
jgi:hypothetical protein